MLLTGTLVTRNPVHGYADLALDIREIQRYLDAEAVDRAVAVFTQGQHAVVEDAATRLTLQDLGDRLARSRGMLTPSFLYQLYGLTNRSTNFAFELEPQKGYINPFVLDAIQTQSSTAAVEAILSVSLAMYATHLL